MQFGPIQVPFRKSNMGWVGLGYPGTAGRGWARLGWAELGWAGLGRIFNAFQGGGVNCFLWERGGGVSERFREGWNGKASMQTNPQRPPLEGLLMVRNTGMSPRVAARHQTYSNPFQPLGPVNLSSLKSPYFHGSWMVA
jgi:hypothetical protein